MSLATAPLSRTSRDVVDEQRRVLFPCAAPYYREPLVLESAQGVWVRDREGREYLDLFAGILTTSVGHCHPEVVEAIGAQASTLGHVSTLYVNEPQVDAARLLSELAPGDLSSSFFTNSGTEAIETAVMLASIHTGSSEVLVPRLGYSGRTILASNLTGQGPWRPLASSVPGIKHVIAPYPYRCPFCRGRCRGDCGEAFAEDLIAVIETTTSGRPAAFLAETILGVGGFIVPPPGYFARAAEIIRSYGGLFISDEVQTGFGRTGDKWFGIEHWGVEPDIMVMAKGIAGGMPVGATIARPEIAASWKAKTISTFGGNPIAMAAMRATLGVLQREDAPRRAAIRGAQLRLGLDELQARHSWIGEARGMGLMQGLELVRDPESRLPDPARAQALLEAAREEGLLIGLGGLKGNNLRIGPSLLISEDELAEGLRRLSRACDRVT
ncbi:MAG TPA: aspartate aminotransferase family protein [Thermoanaerobaculia bacterium]|nr:aspartate aminotransferase family protein [Thermoanaerobaculia bacterium]